jgi:hypothetical protein
MRQLAALALAGSLIALAATPTTAAARTCPNDLTGFPGATSVRTVRIGCDAAKTAIRKIRRNGYPARIRVDDGQPFHCTYRELRERGSQAGSQTVCSRGRQRIRLRLIS